MGQVRNPLITTFARSILLALCLVLASSTWSQETADQRTIQAKFDGTDIRHIVATVAEITGEQFVIHPDVNARVTLEISTPVTVSAFHDIFLSILQAHGYQAVTQGDTTHIVPIGVEPGAGSAPPAADEDAALLGGAIRPTPYFANGQLRGFRVYPGPNRSKFDSLGFKPGDLITEYDGFPLDYGSDTHHFMKSLAASEVKYVKVIRNEEPIVIELP